MTIRLSDLPAEAVETLKQLSRRDFELLSIDATNMREVEQMADLPRDPVEAAKAANACLIRNDERIDIDDAQGFVASVLEVACTALANPDFDSTDAIHLHRIIRAAVNAQQASENNMREARQRLRAMLNK
ncbi:hypothetical protein K1T73_10390 [Roseovarius sp. SCSIO 43702]|uniref:hypothetical protein n=1 Tax=Roseovarius sp. SCSIO 43702 TaxID=2823043 RepID=UPI001C734CBA|nr:hypothetical protein [Roseovarius sp. SCSIO 43702]QYX55510.1 hypothetical protein K1T73_10390 [Roseovarius sp. SCSIO 43702]